MIIWFFAILVYWLADLSANYFWFYFFSPDSEMNEQDGQQLDATFFMIFTYYFVGIQFIILTVLIIWQTTALILIIRVMGTRLAREQIRLRRLAIIFAFAYIGTSTYYICQVATDLHCTWKYSCVRFNDFVVRSGVQFCFDLVPFALLYYQHYVTSRDSLQQQMAMLKNVESVTGTSNNNSSDWKSSTEGRVISQK